MEPMAPIYRPFEDKSDSDSIPAEQACPKEPLLGTAKSSSSLLNLGKLVRQQKKDSDEDDDYVPSSTEKQDSSVQV